MAGVVSRAIVTWLFCLFFLIFLVIRLDEAVTWNWFITFIPLWIYDAISIIYLGVEIALPRRQYSNPDDSAKGRKIWNLIAVILMMTFQTLLCAYLQYDWGLALYHVMIPVWFLFMGCIIDVGLFVAGQR